MNCAPLSCFSVSINWSSSISCTRELWKIRLQKTKWKEKTEKSSEALRPKKNQNSETQKSPEKEFKTHHKHFKSEISRLGKIFRDPRFSRYHSISSIPLCCNCRFPLHSTCRFLTFPLSTWPVNDRHGPTILSWLFSVNLYHLCYWDDCPIFESPTVQTLDQ